ncbi:MAG: hypothetical protein MUE50_11715, partial [Pirellulaceae bacterium]|nr:hypothetical protein [Pirellulaceae bacterium]
PDVISWCTSPRGAADRAPVFPDQHLGRNTALRMGCVNRGSDLATRAKMTSSLADFNRLPVCHQLQLLANSMPAEADKYPATAAT